MAAPTTPASSSRWASTDLDLVGSEPPKWADGGCRRGRARPACRPLPRRARPGQVEQRGGVADDQGQGVGGLGEQLPWLSSPASRAAARWRDLIGPPWPARRAARSTPAATRRRTSAGRCRPDRHSTPGGPDPPQPQGRPFGVDGDVADLGRLAPGTDDQAVVEDQAHHRPRCRRRRPAGRHGLGPSSDPVLGHRATVDVVGRPRPACRAARSAARPPRPGDPSPRCWGTWPRPRRRRRSRARRRRRPAASSQCRAP